MLASRPLTAAFDPHGERRLLISVELERSRAGLAVLGVKRDNAGRPAPWATAAPENR